MLQKARSFCKFKEAQTFHEYKVILDPVQLATVAK